MDRSGWPSAVLLGAAAGTYIKGAYMSTLNEPGHETRVIWTWRDTR